MQRAQQTENFYKSLHMLAAGQLLRGENDIDENSPFEDYSIYMYRQNAPEFKDRVKELEQKLLHPVRTSILNVKRLCEVLVFLAKIAFTCIITLNNANQSQFYAKNTQHSVVD